MSTSILIDTDPGTDDAIAILMALACPAAELAGITTVGGNVPLAKATRNALALLEYIGQPDIPIAPGESRPLKGWFRYAYDFHGPSGLTVRLPRPVTKPSTQRAVEFLAKAAAQSPQPITVVALGPLTNIARLLQQHPQALESIREMVVMGGAVEVPGNITRHAEFNFYNDPWAADLVLSSGLPITLVDLKVCHQALIRREDLDALHRSGRGGKLAGRILANWFRRHPQDESYNLCDPLAMAVAIDPGILTTELCSIRVEVSDQVRRGMCTRQKGKGSVRVATAVDVERFFRLFYRLLD